MKIQTFNSEIAIVQKSTLSTVELVHDLVAYRHEVQVSTKRSGDYPLNTVPSSVLEGIATMSDLQVYLNRPQEAAVESVFPSKNDLPSSNYHFLLQSGRQWLAKNGHFYSTDRRRQKAGAKAFREADVKLPYTAFINGEVTLEDLVYHTMDSFDSNDYDFVMDYDGNPLLTALEFNNADYRGISEHTYNLKKAMQILSKRNDVQFLNSSGDILKRNSHSSKTCRTHRYGFRPGTEYLRILWSPSEQDMQTLWNYCKQLSCHKSTYDSAPMHYAFQAVFEKDLLGLRAGGASLIDIYGDVIDYINDQPLPLDDFEEDFDF
jgi:hypothetical protein